MKLVPRALAVLLGSSLGILTLEVVLRQIRPNVLREAAEASVVTENQPHHPAAGMFELDPDLVYRPSATNADYGSHGALVNDYPLDKRPGVTRVVLLGDSVVAREKISRALRERFDPEGNRIEFWSLGVEGYDTAQELEYFRRFGAALEPDQVVLVFSFNDFRTTPLLFFDNEGELIRLTGRDPERIHRRLLEWSHLYRLWLASQLDAPQPLADGSDRVPPLLAELADEVAASGAEFCAFVQPYLIPDGLLPPDRIEEMYARHGLHLSWFRDCGIPAYDLAGPIRAAIAEGVPIASHEGDVHHPGDEMARRYVTWLADETDWEPTVQSPASEEAR